MGENMRCAIYCGDMYRIVCLSQRIVAAQAETGAGPAQQLPVRTSDSIIGNYIFIDSYKAQVVKVLRWCIII